MFATDQSELAVGEPASVATAGQEQGAGGRCQGFVGVDPKFSIARG